MKDTFTILDALTFAGAKSFLPTILDPRSLSLALTNYSPTITILTPMYVHTH